MRLALAIAMLATVALASPPVRFEWAGTGLLHGVPMNVSAEVREDYTWTCTWTQDVKGKVQVRLVLDGTWENGANDTLVFSTDYAAARVVIAPTGNGRFRMVSSTADVTFDELRLPDGFAARRAAQDAALNRMPDRVLERAVGKP